MQVQTGLKPNEQTIQNKQKLKINNQQSAQQGAKPSLQAKCKNPFAYLAYY